MPSIAFWRAAPVTVVSCCPDWVVLRKEDPRPCSAGAEASVEAAGADSVVEVDAAAAAGVDSAAGVVDAAGAEAAGAGEDEAGAEAAAAGVEEDAAAAAGVALGWECKLTCTIRVHNNPLTLDTITTRKSFSLILRSPTVASSFRIFPATLVRVELYDPPE